MDAPVIETHDLSKAYGRQTAVDRLNLRVEPGEIFGFLGPNGAGKTTTLLMLLGLTEPTSGEVRVMGLDPARDPISVKRQVGYLQENMGFYSDLNGRQMLAYIAKLNGIDGHTAAERIEVALETVGLGKESEKRIAAYSRGMRQRLGIAELMIKSPKVAFLDEPTLGLDPDATNRMIDLIRGMCSSRNMTVVLSSHNLHQVQKICSRVGIMINGKMVAQGSIGSLAQEKLGVGDQTFTLEEIYMKYFVEA